MLLCGVVKRRRCTSLPVAARTGDEPGTRTAHSNEDESSRSRSCSSVLGRFDCRRPGEEGLLTQVPLACLPLHYLGNKASFHFCSGSFDVSPYTLDPCPLGLVVMGRYGLPCFRYPSGKSVAMKRCLCKFFCRARPLVCYSMNDELSARTDSLA